MQKGIRKKHQPFRGFLLAEIEHYVNPVTRKAHDRFHEISHLKLSLLDKTTPFSGKRTISSLSIHEAVGSKLVDNETLGYFFGLFLGAILSGPSQDRSI